MTTPPPTTFFSTRPLTVFLGARRRPLSVLCFLSHHQSPMPSPITGHQIRQRCPCSHRSDSWSGCGAARSSSPEAEAAEQEPRERDVEVLAGASVHASGFSSRSAARHPQQQEREGGIPPTKIEAMMIYRTRSLLSSPPWSFGAASPAPASPRSSSSEVSLRTSARNLSYLHWTVLLLLDCFSKMLLCVRLQFKSCFKVLSSAISVLLHFAKMK